jgi:PPK2 family polyphosphate:nucleotide phosphotransferase
MKNFSKRFRFNGHKDFKLSDIATQWHGAALTRRDEQEQSDEQAKTLSQLQQQLYAEHKHSLLIILQGIDAAGKDGVIKHVMAGINPQGCTVTSFKKPTKEELDHDFLWRIHQHSPRRGEIAVFNRSLYEDVLVVRVHRLVEKSVWSARFEQINQFEALLCSDSSTKVLKFFLHMSPEEQLRRFKKRLEDPLRQWKISAADYTERKFWDDYTAAYEDVLRQTSTDHAPWYIIPSDKKWFRNFSVGQILIEAMQAMDFQLPKPSVDLAAIQREYHDASSAK